MKKLVSIVLAFIIILIPNNNFAKTNNTEDVVKEILSSDSISDETKEWLTWFNGLSAEEQQYINYRPFELDDYNYEKEYVGNFKTYTNEFSDFSSRIFEDNMILPMGHIHDDLGYKILPVGGYEIAYNPTYWNKNRLRANCYTYALNYLASKNKASQQPGYASGKKYEYMTGTSIVNAVKRDVKYISKVKGFRMAGEHEKPGYREYKVALVIAKPNGRFNGDYHWYKQDSDGYWSHKPGSTNVTRADASGRSIINPKTANRKYSYADYSYFVGFFFVKY